MVSCFVCWIGHYFEMGEGVKKKRLIDYTFEEDWVLSKEEQNHLENEWTASLQGR